MININKKYHLHMFDGEGAEGASVSTGTAQTASSVGETSAESAPRVEYGKATEDAIPIRQVGSDNSKSSANDSKGTNDTTPNLDKEFDELIKGKYKEQFGARMQEGIQNRFKNSQDYEVQVGQYQETIAPLMAMYGLEADDIEGLKEAIENDDSLFASRADEEGLTTEKFRENLKLKWDAKLGNDYRQRLEEEKERQAQFEEWDREAEELKQAMPNFDFEKEMESDEFAESLARGNSVQEAFILAHWADMLSASNQQSLHNATNNTINQFKERAARPQESALKPQPAIVRKADPSKFTKEDFMEIRRRVQNGETIVL